ncbi:unknown [Choristoneura occidentalis granulovirus]|uniref:ORF5 n=2 Tax=Betabaculovirus chofumiferanae TaxID=3051997 RepID=Q8JL61_GVCF|nr:unknown [Choristoneura fumiferana granulovirus]AAM60757.1 ORF5 [Choristoneura fumiferana granulovirus]ABC61139.1 unknown [Choristoneura fumiferana granulovirus]
MLSIFFDNFEVYYNFDEVVQLVLKYNLEKADKKMLSVECLKIISANEQVYCTDGISINNRLINYDECYISFEGVMELIEGNQFGDKENLENLLVECTLRVVLNPNHEWLKKYIIRLQARVGASFDLYFKILEQYILANKPCVEKIGPTLNELLTKAKLYRHSPNDCVVLNQSYRSFDLASNLMLQYI